MNMFHLFATLATCVLLALPVDSVRAGAEVHPSHDDERHVGAAHHGRHTFTLFLGPARTLSDGQDEVAVDDHDDAHADLHHEAHGDNFGSVGLGYSYRLNDALGLGLIWERAGYEVLHEAFFMVPAAWYALPNARLVVAPALRYTGDQNEFMLRTGVGYTFHLSRHLGIGPEVNLDWAEQGRVSLVYGMGFETLF